MLKNATHQSNMALKVSVVKRGCSGLTHKIDIVAPNEKDEIVAIKGNFNDILLSQRFEAVCRSQECVPCVWDYYRLCE